MRQAALETLGKLDAAVLATHAATLSLLSSRIRKVTCAARAAMQTLGKLDAAALLSLEHKAALEQVCGGDVGQELKQTHSVQLSHIMSTSLKPQRTTGNGTAYAISHLAQHSTVYSEYYVVIRSYT